MGGEVEKVAAKEAEHVIAKAVEQGGVRDAERVAAREGEQTAAREAMRAGDAETERAIQQTASRARELQQALPEGARGRVTMGSGVGRDEAGNLRRVVGTSEPRGYLRKGVELRDGEELATGDGHAETSILDHMEANRITPLGVGAGRPVCENCEGALNGAGVRITTPLKRVRPPGEI